MLVYTLEDWLAVALNKKQKASIYIATYFSPFCDRKLADRQILFFRRIYSSTIKNLTHFLSHNMLELCRSLNIEKLNFDHTSNEAFI
jgi:hypothetical protein